MPEDFVPSTEMERAYVQARTWPADRAWKLAYTQVSERKLALGTGMYLCLLDYYARRDGIKELFETCEWILMRMESLRPDERLSVCKIVCSIVKSLKEDEFDVKEARLKLILRIPLAVILDAVAEHRLSCALTALLEFSRVFEESVTLKQCSEIEGDFLGVALAIDRAIRAGNVRDKVRSGELKSRAEYDKQRLEAINTADVNKANLVQELALKSQNDSMSNQIDLEEGIEHLDEPNQTADSMPSSNFAANEWGAPAKPALDLPLLAPGELPTLIGTNEQPHREVKKEKQGAVPTSQQSVKGKVVFNANSTQIGKAVLNLVDSVPVYFSLMSLEEQFQHLDGAIADHSVPLCPLLLTMIFSVSGAPNERRHLLALMEVIEKTISIRRENAKEFESCIGIILWRLICLWRETGSLVEGQAYCELMLQRLSRNNDLTNHLKRQILVAVNFVTRYRKTADSLATAIEPSSETPLDESVEFAAMLTSIALFAFHSGRTKIAEAILHKFLLFYSDWLDDFGLRAGEMSWLMQETSLVTLKNCTLALIRHSERAAVDEFLNWKLGVHVRRIIGRVDDLNLRNEILAALIVTRRDRNVYDSFEDRMQKVKEVMSLRNNSFNVEKEAEEERAFTMHKADTQRVLLKLELLAGKKDWKSFINVLRKSTKRLDPVGSIFRLGQLGLIALREDQLDICERIVVLLDSHVSSSSIQVTNYLSEECARRYCRAKNYLRAMQQLDRALLNKHQDVESRNRLRLQLAELNVLLGNLFQATELIYEAYSNIPDSDYGGAKQMLLSR